MNKPEGGRKEIEIVIRDMIEKCEKLGRHPWEIRLTEQDYDELFNYLSENTDMYYREQYEVVPVGIVYHPKPTPRRIVKFLGLPVKVDSETKLLWI